MTEIERIVRADRPNIRLLARLRAAVEAELAGSPFARVDPPAVAAEEAVYALLDGARLWSRSPRLVSLVIELETLARSFGPNGRLRGLRQLSPEAVAALLDEAPGGPALARPVALADGKMIDRGGPEQTVALLTSRPPEDARLLGRLGADRSATDTVGGVAISFLPVADRTRLRALFDAPDAPGRGDLAALKGDLDRDDRARVAAGAARAAMNLQIAFRMWDRRRDHQRGSTAASYLSPAPLAQLALTVVDLVLPRDAPDLFLGDRVEIGRRHRDDARYAEQVRDVFTRILETAGAIAERTAELQGLNLFCGISVTRRVADLIAEERALRDELGGDDGVEDGFDRPESAAQRLIENAMASRDTALLLRAYEAMFLAYTDIVLDGEPADALRAACDAVVRDVCGGLQRRYRLARADLDDGVFYWTDVRRRATGSAQPRRWLPPSVVAAPVILLGSPVAPLLARPSRFAVLCDIVDDIAAEFEDAAADIVRPALLDDRPPPRGPALRGAWTALTRAYPLEDFFRRQ